jgi:hypothetical protein
MITDIKIKELLKKLNTHTVVDYEEKDTFEINEVDPGTVILTGFDLRQLSSHHWAHGYYLLTSNDDLQHICVGKRYSDGVITNAWYLYKHNGAIWYRNKVGGSITAQNIYVE